MTWRAWCSGAGGGVRTSILTSSTTPAPDPTRRVTPQTPRSQPQRPDSAETLLTDPGQSPALPAHVDRSEYVFTNHLAHLAYVGFVGQCSSSSPVGRPQLAVVGGFHRLRRIPGQDQPRTARRQPLGVLGDPLPQARQRRRPPGARRWATPSAPPATSAGTGTPS